METLIRTWRSLGTKPPASKADPAATAGSYRIYYVCRETGEYCYRSASWGDGGMGVHGFYVYGDADGCDEWGRPDGREYSAAEFQG